MDLEPESGFSIEDSKLEPMDCGNDPDQTPPWFDLGQFHRGRRFYQRHFFGCVTAALAGLLILLAIPEILDTLVFTGRSHTKRKAFRRYLGTLRHVNSWFQGDVWQDGDKARRSLLRVRRIHRRLHHPSPPTQYSMALTQFAFVGLVVLFPQRFGIRMSTTKPLEGFVHFWRCIGYLHGIDDRHNICCDTYDGTVRTCRYLLQNVFLLRLAHPPLQYRPMARALVDGVQVIVPFLNFDAFLARTYDVIGHRDPESRSTPLQGYPQAIYWATAFVFDHLLVWFPFLHAVYNIFLHLSLVLAQMTWVKKWGLLTLRRRVSATYHSGRMRVPATPV